MRVIKGRPPGRRTRRADEAAAPRRGPASLRSAPPCRGVDLVGPSERHHYAPNVVQPQTQASPQPYLWCTMCTMAGNDDGAAGWDFFISYTTVDQPWAEWMAWHLEDAGYQILIQAWDFVPGSDWRIKMEEGIAQAARTIAVLSVSYLSSVYGGEEWRAARAADPEGLARKLLPIRVEDCERPGVLRTLVSIDLFGMAAGEARRCLLEEIQRALKGRAKPDVEPEFPVRPGREPPPVPAEFPGQSEEPSYTPSDTERLLLRLLGLGVRDDAASRHLGVSVSTVRRMVSDLMIQLDARSRFQAGVNAAKRGWL